jgi:hypothetical protein
MCGWLTIFSWGGSDACSGHAHAPLTAPGARLPGAGIRFGVVSFTISSPSGFEFGTPAFTRSLPRISLWAPATAS